MMTKQTEIKPQKLIFYIILFGISVLLSSVQVIASQFTFVRILNLILVITLSIIIQLHSVYNNIKNNHKIFNNPPH